MSLASCALCVSSLRALRQKVALACMHAGVAFSGDYGEYFGVEVDDSAVCALRALIRCSWGSCGRVVLIKAT